MSKINRSKIVNQISDDNSSKFYQGNNIINTLKNSAFNKLKHIIDKLISVDPETLKEYKLPKVLMIGHESVGKSSLIENITKCQIFPRNSSICTKAPVRLVLKNGNPSYKLTFKNYNKQFDDKKYIYSEIETLMKSVVLKNVSNDEIVVEISDIDVPDFEFIDLPGIRAYPETDAKITTEITQSYLTMYPDSIIICVVPSVTPSLTSCRSIALVKEANMEKNCILAMTMIDRLQPEIIDDLLINRLIGKSDELNGFNFSSIVGVINRIHTDKISLVDNDQYEKRWFDKNILSKLNHCYKNDVAQIESKITLPCLLKQMDTLYNRSINENWIPKISQKVVDDKQKLQKEKDELGSATLTCSAITVMYSRFLNILKNHGNQIVQHVPLPSYSPDCTYTDNFAVGIESKKNLCDKLKSRIDGIISDIINRINKEFDTVHQQYKPHRFSKIKPDFIARLKESAVKLRDSNIDYYIQPISTYIDMCTITACPITEHNINTLLENTAETFKEQLLNLVIVANCQYDEDEKYASIRSTINTKIKSLNNYLNKIKDINFD